MTVTNHSIKKLGELFIKDRKREKSPSTIYNNRGHLRTFVEWCESQDIDSVKELDGSHFLEYKFHLQEGVSDATIRNHFSTLRTFFKFCNRIDAVDPDQHLHKKLEAPDFAKGDLSRDIMMDFDEVKSLLAYQQKFEYATLKHTLFSIFWHTGCRMGALRGLDLEDYSPIKNREHGEYALIRFRHRPETRLKNGEGGEREVIVWPAIGEVIEDYIEMNRHDVVDNSRKPLFSTTNGRISPSNIRNLIYAISRPCYYSNECPHDRNIEDCEAAYYEHASKCPSSVSPHPMRRTSITYHLEEKDWTYEACSQRFDVGTDTLREHYDQSTDEGRRKTRASMFFDGDQSII